MKPCKKEPKAPALPRWKKQRGNFTYEIEDPVTGGFWRYCGKRKMSDTELLERVLSIIVIGRGDRPKRGQVAELHPHGDD
jgi:hypothetical protein